MHVLMVLTSHADMGETGNKTGFWLEEFAAPYYVFTDAGVDVTLASPAGGQPPLDPNSDTDAAATRDTRRFKADSAAQEALANTKRLADVFDEPFDGVFYPGGHGPLWDLAGDRHSIALIEATIARHTPVALVCHAPGALRHVRASDGTPLVSGKTVTGFSNSEEAAVGLDGVVPFSVEDTLIENGGDYHRSNDWQSHVCEDGVLITGQNPASSADTANALLARLGAG